MKYLPDAMLQSMGAAWRQQQAYKKKHLSVFAAPDA